MAPPPAGALSATATAVGKTGGATVTVAQEAFAIDVQAGQMQAGTVGEALPIPLAVQVRDSRAVVVAGATVVFAVTAGGGSVAPTTVVTDANGGASTTWTLGTSTSGAQTVTASVTGAATPATFTATALAGPAAQIEKVAGDGQTYVVSTAVPVDPQVRVKDAHGNPKPGVMVRFVVASGGGTVSPDSQQTNSLGLATVTDWILGAAPGTNTLSATVSGTVITTTFTATGAAVGAPASVAVLSGDNQTALVGYATNLRPAVIVRDAGNFPVSGAQVVFTPSAGGSVTAGTVITGAQGIAQVGSWTPGATAGTHTLSAAVTSTALSTVFTAGAVNPSYDIVIQNIGPALSPAVQAAIDSARAFWQRIIYQDQTDVPVNVTSACGISGVDLNQTIDDVIILARFDSIDGPSGVLGSAGACSVRSSNALTVYGQMRFDTADVASLGAQLNNVILHEMGHVLGFASGLFNFTTSGGFTRACGNLFTTGTPPSVVPQDTYFHCTHSNATNQARAVFDSIGGTAYTGGNKVPLENCQTGVPTSCGPGTYNSHWRESTFFNELMTGYLNSGNPNPLSVLTIAAFGDLGYTVNYAAAAAYSRTFSAPAASRGAVLDLGDDVLRVPILVLDDRTGTVLRVIQPR